MIATIARHDAPAVDDKEDIDRIKDVGRQLAIAKKNLPEFIRQVRSLSVATTDIRLNALNGGAR
jgi:hypothetical protein